MKNWIAGFAALVAVTSHQDALAAQAAKPCLSNGEFRSVAVTLLPALHNQAVSSCKAHLPSNAGLLVQSAELTAKYNAAAEKERTAAGNILARLLADELPVPMSGSAILPFIEGMVPAMLAQSIDAKACEAANNIWTALAPLPSENIASTLGAILLANSNDKRDGESNASGRNNRALDSFAVCPYVATVEASGS